LFVGDGVFLGRITEQFSNLIGKFNIGSATEEILHCYRGKLKIFRGLQLLNLVPKLLGNRPVETTINIDYSIAKITDPMRD